MVAGSDGRERKLRAKTILIATGSRPRRPRNISFDIPGVCDTDTILNRGALPETSSLWVADQSAWSSPTICHALGAKVAIADLGSRLIPAMDGELVRLDGRPVPQVGVTVYFGSTAESIEARDDGLVVKLSDTADAYTRTRFCSRRDGSPIRKASVWTPPESACDSRGRINVDR